MLCYALLTVTVLCQIFDQFTQQDIHNAPYAVLAVGHHPGQNVKQKLNLIVK